MVVEVGGSWGSIRMMIDGQRRHVDPRGCFEQPHQKERTKDRGREVV